MPHLIWSPTALRDMQRVYRFLAAKDPAAAKRAVTAIRQGVKPLANFPNVGRPAPDLGPNCRRWVVQFGRDGYTLLYRADRGTVILLSLRHQKEAAP